MLSSVVGFIRREMFHIFLEGNRALLIIQIWIRQRKYFSVAKTGGMRNAELGPIKATHLTNDSPVTSASKMMNIKNSLI